MNVRKKKKIRNKLEALNINQGKTHLSIQPVPIVELTELPLQILFEIFYMILQVLFDSCTIH